MSGDLTSLKGGPGSVYEVRVKEPTPGCLAAQLTSRGAVVSEGQDGSLRVTLEEPDPRFLFESARIVGAELRSLRRFEPSLEELFLTAVGRQN
jgi:hypothetical protein